MDIEELESFLRKSSMDYSLKANLYLHGVAFTPCADCPFKNEYPPVSILEKTRKCLKRCTFLIMIWILSKEQSEIHKEVRPLEMKEKDMEKAINERKIIQIEA